MQKYFWWSFTNAKSVHRSFFLQKGRGKSEPRRKKRRLTVALVICKITGRKVPQRQEFRAIGRKVKSPTRRNSVGRRKSNFSNSVNPVCGKVGWEKYFLSVFARKLFLPTARSFWQQKDKRDDVPRQNSAYRLRIFFRLFFFKNSLKIPRCLKWVSSSVVEQLALNQLAVGSTPTSPTNFQAFLRWIFLKINALFENVGL